MRDSIGIASPTRPSGYPPPPTCSWEERTTAPTSARTPPTFSSISCPTIVWRFMTTHWSSSSGPGLSMIRLDTAMPMSWSSAPSSTRLRCAEESDKRSATASDSSTTPREWRPV